MSGLRSIVVFARRLPRLPSSRSGVAVCAGSTSSTSSMPGALEVAVELLDVALVDVDLGDRGRDLAEGQHSDLLALAQQVLYLFEFLKLSYKHSASSCSVLWFVLGVPCAAWARSAVHRAPMLSA